MHEHKHARICVSQTCTSTHVHVRVRMHTYDHARAHVCFFKCMRARTCVCTFLHVSERTCTSTRAHMRAHADACKCVHKTSFCGHSDQQINFHAWPVPLNPCELWVPLRWPGGSDWAWMTLHKQILKFFCQGSRGPKTQDCWSCNKSGFAISSSAEPEMPQGHPPGEGTCSAAC